VSTVLSLVSQIVSSLSSGQTVTIQDAGPHYLSASLLLSLVQIVVDPYYRSLLGFSYLIEREWSQFGYVFIYSVFWEFLVPAI
jgi:hypothetical protein